MATRVGGNTAYPEVRKVSHLPCEINNNDQAKTPAPRDVALYGLR